MALLGLGKKEDGKKELPKSIYNAIESYGIPPEDVIFSAEGHNGQVILTEGSLIIGREGFWKKLKSKSFTKGNKRISYKDITGVQFEEPGITVGYIQFTVPGGIESKGGVFAGISDENTVAITGKKQLEDFRKIRDIVEEKIHAPSVTAPPRISAPSIADELNKLASLKREGLITDEEYENLKDKLIGNN